MVSGGLKVNCFALIRWILEGKFEGDSYTWITLFLWRNIVFPRSISRWRWSWRKIKANTTSFSTAKYFGWYGITFRSFLWPFFNSQIYNSGSDWKVVSFRFLGFLVIYFFLVYFLKGKELKYNYFMNRF